MSRFLYSSKYKFPGVGNRVWIDHGPTSAELAMKKENGWVVFLTLELSNDKV